MPSGLKRRVRPHETNQKKEEILAGRKSALRTTVRPHLPELKDVGRYLLKEWRQHPSRAAVGVLALDETNHTHFMRVIGTFKPDEVVWFEPEPILAQMQESGAAKFVVWITHPDGDPRPWRFDNFLLADRVNRAIEKNQGIPMIDLVVIGHNSFFSWAIHEWDQSDPLVRKGAD